MLPEFEEFHKIARLNRNCVITEKLDGTNAQIFIDADGILFAGSRNRWITPDADNYGFARWAREHEAELVTGLGPGRHYGEWWGNGIQRGYGLPRDDKRFSLFNTHKWTAETTPPCCSVVPVLYQGLFNTEVVGTQIERLRQLGSVAVPGFAKPEGVVVYHEHANRYFKVTLERDETPKSLVK